MPLRPCAGGDTLELEQPMQSTAQGGGIRPPDYEYELAISRTEDLMVQAFPWKRIVAMLSEEGYTESEETARKWRREVLRRWAAEDAEMRPARKDLWRARLDAQYRTLLEKAAEVKSEYAFAMLHAEATRIAKVAIVMDGLTAPVVVKHEGQIDVAAMSPMEREREIAALLAKREAAMRALAESQGNN